MLELAGQPSHLTGAAAQRLAGLSQYVGGDIAIGIRPEVARRRRRGRLDVQVDLVEMLGSEKPRTGPTRDALVSVGAR